MIAVKSTKKLKFPPNKEGFITVKIELIQNNVDAQSYELRLRDECLDDDGVLIGANVRYKTYSYSDINLIAQAVGFDAVNPLTAEQLNDLFKHGLLMTTKLDLLYFSDAVDWEFV